MMGQAKQHLKIKSKPPPLHLSCCGEGEGIDVTLSESPSHALADAEESKIQSEFYAEFETTLAQLLHEDDLMPFNLHTAASLGITSCVRQLIERCNINPDSRNNGNWTALMYASLFSHNETVLYLLEMKANVNLKNPEGKTPLMLAALCGSEDTLKLLIQHGALLEERDRDQFTALMLAIQATHSESAQLLLEYGADPNVREGMHGQTPLYIAAQTGQFAVARGLIQKNVDVNVKTMSGDTAYDAALRNGYTAIANLISERREILQLRERILENPDKTTFSNITSNLKSPEPGFGPLPTRFKPKSPYTAFFERFSNIPEAKEHRIPEVVVDDVDGSQKREWFSPPNEITRRSPEGLESRDTFNPFNAWPGISMIFKQATRVSPINYPTQRNHFKKSITKPVCVKQQSSVPWSPVNGEYLLGACQNSSYSMNEIGSVKLPKDLSSVLANLGLAKYQMHFEEQDIDLQVFLTMNESDLREIGINSLGARRKFLSIIEYYQTRSNYYRISEEFLVSTWVSKKDLAELKKIWNEMLQTVCEIRRTNKSPLTDLLVNQAQQAGNFFKKY